jgi:hypothetical protein
MRTVVAQFFRRIPGAVGLNATVAFGSAAAFLLSYELLVLVKMFGPIVGFKFLSGLPFWPERRGCSHACFDLCGEDSNQ